MRDLKRLFGYLGPYRRDMIIGMLLVVVETCFELVIPVLMSQLIDVGVKQRDVSYILQKGAQMGVCAILSLITGRFTRALPPAPPMDGARASARRSLSACRNTLFPISTTSPRPR